VLEKKIELALSRPDSFSFHDNEISAESILNSLTSLHSVKQNGATVFHGKDAPNTANTRIKIYKTGHMAFYNDEGRRFLGTDPGGHPLHEAKWSKDPKTGETSLELARMQLDSLQWVGIKPKSRTFESQIDIKGQPGWEDMTLDFLRETSGGTPVAPAPPSEPVRPPRSPCRRRSGC